MSYTGPGRRPIDSPRRTHIAIECSAEFRHWVRVFSAQAGMGMSAWVVEAALEKMRREGGIPTNVERWEP